MTDQAPPYVLEDQIGFKLRLELVPIDKMRPDQRRKQRDDKRKCQSEQRCLQGVL